MVFLKHSHISTGYSVFHGLDISSYIFFGNINEQY